MRIDIRKFSLILLVAVFAAQAWVNPEYIEEGFHGALKEFRAGDYKKAGDSFSSILIDSRGTPYYAMTYFMLGLSYYKAGDYDASARQFGDFAGKLPDNPATGNAWVYKGNSHYHQNEYLEAIKAYLNAMDSPSTNSQTRDVATKSVRALLWGYLTKDQLTIVGDYAEGPSSQLVDYIRVKRHEHSAEYSRALEIASRSLTRRPEGIYADSLKSFSNRISKDLSENLTLAVLAPKTGEYSDFGQSLINGVSLAVDKFKQSSRKNIDLIIEDTGADILVGAYAAKSIFNRRPPAALIGPLVSDVSVSVGAFCHQYSVPMVSPTASKDGLAGLSPYIFQVAIPPSVGAAKLAEYAYNFAGIARFSALAPNDALGRKTVAIFAKTVEDLGGEMVSISYYSEGTMDFSENLKEIREPYYKEMERQCARAETTDTRFYKPDGTMRKENEWIVHIPAIFVPGYYEDLINILPQVPFNYIKTRLLGANGWIIDEIRRMEASYIDSAIVVADNFWADTENPRWEGFAREYRKSYGYDPDRIAALAYDAANIVCAGLESGAITAEQMRDYLAGVSGHNGVSGDISFDPDGTNIDANIVIFDRKTPKRIEMR